MLGLPRSTEVNRRIAKEKLYSYATLTASIRDMIKNQIESVVWRNKLAESTMSIRVGETAREIQIFEIQLRQKELDKRILPTIAKAIPYKILFILVFRNEAQAWIEVGGSFYNTDWQLLERFTLKFEGLNLDSVYESLARQIAGGRLGTDGDIEEAVERDKKLQIVEREIIALQKKIQRENQFNKQVEMNNKLKKLKNELLRLNENNI